MTIQLLINEEAVKSLFPELTNVAGEYLTGAMFEAQEIRLKSILGSRLLRKLKTDEAAGALTGKYAELKDELQVFLAAQTATCLIPRIALKISNAGVMQATDTNLQPATDAKYDSTIEDYQARADYLCLELQRYLLANQGSFPELGSQAGEIKANLLSMASCGINLGLARSPMDGRIL